MNHSNERHLTDRQLEELLTMNELAEAPAGLAERIKGEIPEDLGALPDAGGGKVLPFHSRVPFRVLALAATLMAVVGASFLTYRLSREPEPVSTVAERSSSDDGEAISGEVIGGEDVGLDSTSNELRQEPASALARSAETGEMRSADELVQPPVTRGTLEDAEKKGDGGRFVVGGRTAEVQRQPAEAEPQPQSAPVEPPLDRVDLDLSAGVESELDALGYAAGADQGYSQTPVAEGEERTYRDAMPIQMSAPVAPVPAPPALAAPRAQLRKRLEEVPRRGVTAPPSTGGTAEPNDQPYGDVFFESAGVNPFVDTEDDAQSTFGLDVDTGSYTVGRRYLRDGHLPPPESVRVEEYVNYFDYGDEPPAEGDFAIHAEGAPSIFGQSDRYYLLRFNVHGREIDAADRQPAHLVFVVDVSGSMDRENRLGLVKKALGLLIGQLRSDDLISLVVYGSRGRVVLEPTSDRDAIRRAIEGLHSEGSTNAEEGLRLAYELAARHLRRGAINRVILCSDGVANVGDTSAESIRERIRRHADQGVELTTVGFGMGNYNDVLMERLADTGNGRYAYVDTLDEARRIFVEDLTGTLQTIAAEARVQVEFNPTVVSRYRLLGYENRDIADERFRDDTVDAGEIGAGHTVTALYEIKLEGMPRRRDEIATLHLRWASAAEGEVVETSRTVTGRDFARSWDKASPALRLTSLVAEFAELLKGTYWSKGGEVGRVFFRAQQVSADFAGDRDVADFVSLVGRAAEHQRREE